AACNVLYDNLDNLSPKQINEYIVGRPKEGDEKHAIKIAKSEQVSDWTGPVPRPEPGQGLLQKYPDLHLSYAISFATMWASAYFAMTGFHALHVFGGLVVFAIMIGMYFRGRFGVQHLNFVEYTGLYWHFVDIVWIFLFPLLYLV